MLCKFKNFFGKPGEGVHSYRLANFAIIDVLLTVIFSFFIAKFFKWDFKLILIGMFLLGIISHRIFCVKTQLDKLLFE